MYDKHREQIYNIFDESPVPLNTIQILNTFKAKRIEISDRTVRRKIRELMEDNRIEKVPDIYGYFQTVTKSPVKKTKASRVAGSVTIPLSNAGDSSFTVSMVTLWEAINRTLKWGKVSGSADRLIKQQFEELLACAVFERINSKPSQDELSRIYKTIKEMEKALRTRLNTVNSLKNAPIWNKEVLTRILEEDSSVNWKWVIEHFKLDSQNNNSRYEGLSIEHLRDEFPQWIISDDSAEGGKPVNDLDET